MGGPNTDVEVRPESAACIAHRRVPRVEIGEGNTISSSNVVAVISTDNFIEFVAAAYHAALSGCWSGNGVVMPVGDVVTVGM